MSFGARLHAAMARHGRLCVGVDPHPELLRAWGLADDAAGLERFALSVVDAVGDRVAVLKPQSAFFERFGSAGIAVLERVVADARSAGALVLLDVKRGDIGSTSQAYADAYLDPTSPLAVDAVTASPYLGFGSLTPLIDTALANGRGVFVLALTSNREGGEVQHAVASDGRTVAGVVLDHLRSLNAGASPLGSVGAVVGATVSEAAVRAAGGLAVNGPLLAPGLGAQGATVADVRRVFGSAAASVLPSSSREILREGPSAAGLRSAVARARDELATLADP